MKYIGIVALVGVAIAIGAKKDSILEGMNTLLHRPAGAAAGAPPRIVTVDVAQLLNAQRRLAAGLLKGGGTEEQGEVISSIQSVSARLYETIEQVAGPGTLVVVKQAVVVPAGTQDITKLVMEKLNLPQDVPTINPNAMIEPSGQTNLALTRGPANYEKNARSEVQEYRERGKGAGDRETKDLLP
jgi:hypothetical protein